jgi:hypothetical protein
MEGEKNSWHSKEGYRMKCRGIEQKGIAMIE